MSSSESSEATSGNGWVKTSLKVLLQILIVVAVSIVTTLVDQSSPVVRFFILLIAVYVIWGLIVWISWEREEGNGIRYFMLSSPPIFLALLLFFVLGMASEWNAQPGRAEEDMVDLYARGGVILVVNLILIMVWHIGIKPFIHIEPPVEDKGISNTGY